VIFGFARNGLVQVILTAHWRTLSK